MTPGTSSAKMTPGTSSAEMTPDAGSVVRGCLVLAALALLIAVPFWLPWRALDSFLSDPAGTRITDRSGALLSLVLDRRGELQEHLGFTEIPSECRRLFVELEDVRFYRHPGVDPLALGRAFLLRLRGGGSGASTMTMQLARIISPHSRSFAGKLVEAFHALKIESRLSKEEILSLYLDSLPYGRNTKGVAAAAWTYFDAALSDLSPAQLLALSIIPRNPSVYDPFDHPVALIAAASQAARHRDLAREMGIGEGDIRAAVLGARSGRPPSHAPHFSRFVSTEIREGKLRARAGEIRTTLDLALNDFIEERVRFYLDRYAQARVTNAAVVAIDNAGGTVIGWVGSGDFSDDARSGQIDGALIRRQSASTLKPFLYARALENGWTPATLLPDSPIEFGSAGDETYRPVNFDRRSHGVVRLRTALASSLNVPAVFTLSRVGVRAFAGDLRSLGFALPADTESRSGLGMAIGNAEVSLLDLVHAFTVFPRGGTFLPLAVTPAQSPGGGSGGGPGGQPAARIFDPATAWLICSILSDPSARATGFGTRTYFRTPFPSMFKSGTSSEFTNLWAVGATPRYTVGAWAGNFDGRTVINKTGSIVPTQLVADVLNRLTTAPADFQRPPGIVEARIDTLTGMRATPLCPSTRSEYFRSEAQVPPPCTYHENPRGRETLLLESLLGAGETLRILFPVDGQVFYLDTTVAESRQSIPLVAASRGGKEITLSIDGQQIRSHAPEGEISLPARRGHHVIIARTSDAEARAVYDVR